MTLLLHKVISGIVVSTHPASLSEVRCKGMEDGGRWLVCNGTWMFSGAAFNFHCLAAIDDKDFA